MAVFLRRREAQPEGRRGLARGRRISAKTAPVNRLEDRDALPEVAAPGGEAQGKMGERTPPRTQNLCVGLGRRRIYSA
ncbi:hypothetical protein CR492_09340 [Methylocella silvestris]|uniref:Uncharacterized protein n=1 Tax=Methylocella silvestris TaxID=199596 RepID=A0A2J7THS8_METSI|nr:hypothetical protein CR492_09340 [Methylocella silvestris]